jgi:hypothetical protein
MTLNDRGLRVFGEAHRRRLRFTSRTGGRAHTFTPSITHDIAIVGTMRVSRKPAAA